MMSAPMSRVRPMLRLFSGSSSRIERAAQDRAVRLDIHFLHECRFGQTLRIGCELHDELALFEIGCGETAAVRASLTWR